MMPLEMEPGKFAEYKDPAVFKGTNRKFTL